MNTRVIRFLFGTIIAGAIALSLLVSPMATPTHAAPTAPTFTVNSPSDIVAAAPLNNGICETASGDNVCTLRAAVMKANHFPGGGVTINVPAGTYYLNIPAFGTDDEMTGDLNITQTMSIVGAGASTTIVDANNNVTHDRAFLIGSGVTTTISGVTIRNGNVSSLFAFGGGVANLGVLTLVNSTVMSNTTNSYSYNFGGGIFNTSVLMLVNSTVISNTSYMPVGIDNNSGGGIYNGSAGKLTLTNSTVSGNTSGFGGGLDYGGGIMNDGGIVMLANSTVSGNATPYLGGGIFTNGTLTITNSTVNGNSAGYGGGISMTGTLTITNSTINRNTAAYGGGIWKGDGPLSVINSTISDNSSTVHGGGIYANAGTTGLYNVTITQNRANSDNVGTGYGGGVYNATGSTFNFVNSIMALNENVVTPGPFLLDDDCAGTINSLGNNIMYLVNASHCTLSGSVTIADPNLGPLQNNGGPTSTHALLAGSPAIDAGNPGGCTDNLGAILKSDQRGFHRPAGVHCDIGAFEYNFSLFLPLIVR